MITHDTTKHRFETVRDGLTAEIDYIPFEGGIDMTHTYVPPELEGRGIASELARFALDHARENGLKVIPSCPFIRVYMQRHPEYQSLTKER